MWMFQSSGTVEQAHRIYLSVIAYAPVPFEEAPLERQAACLRLAVLRAR